MVLLSCRLKPSTNVRKTSVLGVAGVLDPPLELCNVLVKFLQVFKLSKVAGLLY